MEFVAIDFLDPLDTTIKRLRSVCKDVTHAYFTSYIHVADFGSLRDKNVPLFQNFLQAIDAVAPSLQRVSLQTGCKASLQSLACWPPCLIRRILTTLSQHYGCHLGPVPIPVRESLGRSDTSGTNFYYEQEDYLFEMAAKRTWSYNIVRPHAIVGYAPGCELVPNPLSTMATGQVGLTLLSS